jgi:hypothetical protein
MKGKRPDFTVSTVIQTGNGDRWREIGVGFASDKGDTITVLLDALPVSGKLVLTPPKQTRASTPASRAPPGEKAESALAARRDLFRVAVVERGIRPVDVSRLLGISTASVAEHLAATRRDEKG